MDYFDIDYLDSDENENDDTYFYADGHPKAGSTLEELINFDKEFLNRIFNYDELSDADRANVARVFSDVSWLLLETNSILKSLENFLIEKNGKEWYYCLVADMNKWKETKQHSNKIVSFQTRKPIQ